MVQDPAPRSAATQTEAHRHGQQRPCARFPPLAAAASRNSKGIVDLRRTGIAGMLVSEGVGARTRPGHQPPVPCTSREQIPDHLLTAYAGD